MKHVLLGVIRAYRYLLKPWWGNQCRFTPSCSEYAMGAIEVHGALHGSWLATRRICRCHPWHAGGIDPVPGTHRP
jgi:putative membrane protein insertion efficiency factor